MNGKQWLKNNIKNNNYYTAGLKQQKKQTKHTEIKAARSGK